MRGALKTYYRSVRPIEEMEWALVRDWTDRPRAVSRLTEHVMRYALGLARLRTLAGADGVEQSVEGLTQPFRRRLVEAFRPMILDNLGTVEHGWLESERDGLAREIDRLRATILEKFADRFSEEALEREITRKKLVVVAGGGGGCGYVYLGAFKLLEDHGLRPSYVVGTSMGAVLGLFRAREENFEYRRAVDTARRVQFRQVFEYFRTESRYGLPAALHLYLHRAIGDEFRDPDGRPLTLEDLPIPFEAVVTGVRREAVKRDLRDYENLIEVDERGGPLRVKRLRGGIRRLPALFG
ncbi:MAG: patatin-like phospholipase family protein, partial [Candidatus Methylomirabilis sp.]|nr:patatin-like phospholipase family protein [Deltaproteobacteria bacterium]